MGICCCSEKKQMPFEQRDDMKAALFECKTADLEGTCAGVELA